MKSFRKKIFFSGLLVLGFFISFYIFEKKNENLVSHNKAIVSFVFDDGLISDRNVYKIFNEYNFKCGFAIVTNTLDTTRISEYQEYQKAGFEIISHSLSHPFMNERTVQNEINIKNELLKSKEILEKWGFNIKGFVTPMSVLHKEFLPIVQENYEYAFTEYYGSPKIFERAYLNDFESKYELKRLNVEKDDIDIIKQEVKKAIENKKILFIYAHKFPKENGLNESELIELLKFLKANVENQNLEVVTPAKAVNMYFVK